MFEWEASLAMRVETVETALSALYDTVPHGQEARAELLERLRAKIVEAEFASDRRHQLERVATHVEKMQR